MKKPVCSVGNLLIYDDENIKYYSGVPIDICYEQDVDYCQTLTGHTYTLNRGVILTTRIQNYDETDNITLDETMMKRIAKFNKEQEIKKLDEKIKQKNKKIKELDDILQDKEGRVAKLKQFIANIYDIDINDDEDYDF